MYKPISFNVIRQALRWQGFPIPLIRVVSSVKWPDGSTSAEYMLAWPKHDIAVYFANNFFYHGTVERKLRDCLQHCFADDITVVEVRADNAVAIYTALINCRVDAKDYDQLSLF